MKNEQIQKGYIWYGLRIGFYVLLIWMVLGFLAGFFPNSQLYYLDNNLNNILNKPLYSSISLGLEDLLGIHNFILSFFYLRKYKDRTIPIISIIIFLIGLGFIIWAFL